MKPEDLRTLDAFAFNVEQTGHGQAWGEMVDTLAGGQSESLRLYLKAVNPQAVQQLIKALRKMADGYSRSWYAERAARWDEGPEPEELAAKAAELIAKALED